MSCPHGKLDGCAACDRINELFVALAKLERAVSYVAHFRDATRHPDLAQALVEARTVMLKGDGG